MLRLVWQRWRLSHLLCSRNCEHFLAAHYERVQVGISYINVYIKHIHYLERREVSQKKTGWPLA